MSKAQPLRWENPDRTKKIIELVKRRDQPMKVIGAQFGISRGRVGDIARRVGVYVGRGSDCHEALSAVRVRELLRYDPNTGVFTGRKRQLHMKNNEGSVAGCILTTTGYRQIMVNKRKHSAHRLAWLYSYGRWPQQQLDHVNGDRADNRLSNLREASPAQNNANKSACNSTGFKGVSRSGRSWYATFRGKCIGKFATAEDAGAAYAAAATAYFGAFARAS